MKKRESYIDICNCNSLATRNIWATVVIGKTIARKTAAGKCHFCMHTKRSGRARQRVRKKGQLYASPPFSECASGILHVCRTNDLNFMTRSEQKLFKSQSNLPINQFVNLYFIQITRFSNECFPIIQLWA